MSMNKAVRLFSSALITLCVTVPVAKAAYPERPITMIVALAAGGGTDISARTVAKYLETELGGHIVVINKTGASGAIGLAELAKSAPDGYTLGIINTPGIVSIPIERNAGFNVNSFDFLAATTYDPGTISVRADGPFKTLADFVAEAKKRPGEVTVATQGVGSAGHIAVLMLEAAAGIDLKPIPFTGSSNSRNALLANEVDAVAVNFGEAVSFSQGTSWRILGIMADKRNPIDATVPTFSEAGYPIQTGSLRGFAGPKGMPPEVVEKLTLALRKIGNDPDFINASNKTFQPAIYLEGKDYVAELHKTEKDLKTLWATTPWRQ